MTNADLVHLVRHGYLTLCGRRVLAVEDVAGVRFAARRAAEQERNLAVRLRVLREVVATITPRTTRYPALANCPACRNHFTADELKATDPNQQDEPVDQTDARAVAGATPCTKCEPDCQKWLPCGPIAWMWLPCDCECHEPELGEG